MKSTKILLAAAAPGFLASALPGAEDGLVSLSGSPSAIGRRWGTMNRAAIRNDLEAQFLGPARVAGISETVMVERSRTFIAIAERLAPHWLDEARAVARAAEVRADLYLAFIANVYRGLFLHEECTSYAVSPAHTAGRAVLFHKNRDNVDRAQAAFILESDVPGVNKFIAVSDASVISCMMMVNDKGLAGSADTGGLAVEAPRFRGVMNTFLLRHIAERASTCAEALALVQEFVRRGEYAGGDKTGTHWLFVDKAGTILEISHNSDALTHAYHTDKVYFSVRGDSAAARRLREAPAPVDFALFHGVSRDSSICFKSSIAGMTVEIDRERPDLKTCAWITLPAHAGAFPLLMGGRGTPRSLLDGEAYRQAREHEGLAQAWEPLERVAHRSKAQLAERRSSAADDRETWRKEADEWSADQAAVLMTVLQVLNRKGQARDRAEEREPHSSGQEQVPAAGQDVPGIVRFGPEAARMASRTGSR